MKQTLIMDLAKAAQRDGLTLPWCLIHLAEQIERNQQRLDQSSRRETHVGDTDAQVLRVENEALALVVAAVLKAYPAAQMWTCKQTKNYLFLYIYIGTIMFMDSVTTHDLTFRRADDHLIITTPKGQYMLDAQEAALLLDMLYAQKDEIFDAEAHTDGLAAWARQHPGQQFVIGSLNPQSEPTAPPPLSLDEGRARRLRNEDANG